MLGSPVNLVFLGGGDPILSSPLDIEAQLKAVEQYRAQLLQLNAMKAQGQVLNVQSLNQPTNKLIWDEIDAEVAPLTNEQKNRLFLDDEYAELYNHLLEMVQAEILSLVKGRIESTPEGKLLLERQITVVKKLKSKIVDESNKEMDIFRRFREYVKVHPNATYEEFIKEIM